MRAGPKSRSRRRPPISELTLGANVRGPGAGAVTSSKQDTRNEIAPLLDTGSGRGRSEARVLVAVAAAAAAAVPAAAAASITTAAAAASVAALAVPAAAASPTTPIAATAAVAAAAAAPTSITASSITAAAAVEVAALLLRLELGQDLADLERELVEVLLLAEGQESLRRRASHVEDRLRRFLADADRTNSIIVVRRRALLLRDSL